MKYLFVLIAVLALFGCTSQRSSSADAGVSLRCSVDQYGPEQLPSGITATVSRLRVISPASLMGRRILVDLLAEDGAPASHRELRHIGAMLTLEMPQSAIERAMQEVIPWNVITVASSLPSGATSEKITAGR